MSDIHYQSQNYITAACRTCFRLFDIPAPQARHAISCPECESRRVIAHAELTHLNVAHIDCDAFYASVEKRDNPALRSQPVIIGGGQRGVVATACYIARMSGVKSAMPMFQARKLCPDAAIVSGNMEKYRTVSQQIKAKFKSLTPMIEPLSLDEAFLDLSGTEKLHDRPPVLSLMHLTDEIEREIGITVSVGLAPNKFLAKLASDMDKPRGFTVIGESDAQAILAPLEIRRIYGIGKKTAEALAKDGLTHIHQLQKMEHDTLIVRYGDTGARLWRLARGIDKRKVEPDQAVKSVSAETTFNKDKHDQESLEAALWQQCERVARDAKRKGLAGVTITLKLKSSSHKSYTRSRTIDYPTQLAETLFEQGRELLSGMIGQHSYRLIGIGLSRFRPLTESDQPDLIEPGRTQRAKAERAMDALRGKFGNTVIGKGRGFSPAKKS